MSSIRVLSLSAVVCLVPALNAQRIVETIAGTELTFRWDGDPAQDAALGRVFAVAVDAAGRPTFSDRYYNVVIRVEENGVARVVAGNNIKGFSGDGGSARLASLNDPTGVAYDAAGNLYIADSLNHRVRRVTPQGIITTVAGSRQGYKGDGGPARQAELNLPTKVAVGAGNLYIFDHGNSVIRRVDANGNISTVAGGGTTQGENVPARQVALTAIEGLAADAAGNVYLTDFQAHRVRVIGTNGNIRTIAGTGQRGFSGDSGPAERAQLSSPGGVAVDRQGVIYISDTGNYVIRKISGGVISTIGGSGTSGFSGDGAAATRAQFRNAFGLAVASNGDIFIADRDNFRIRRIDASGVITTVAGNGGLQRMQDGLAATTAPLVQPLGLALDSAGNLLIADTSNNVIRRVTPDGRVFTIAGNGAAEHSGDDDDATKAGLFTPAGIAADSQGGVYIGDTDNHRVRRIAGPQGIITLIAGNGTPGYSGDNGPARNAQLSSPFGIAVDRAGNVYIADFFNHAVRRVERATGIITTFAGNNTTGAAGDGGPANRASVINPAGVAFDTAGNLYIAEMGPGRIRKVSPDGRSITTVAGGGALLGLDADRQPATRARLERPTSVAVDDAGNVYFTDFRTNLVQRIGTDGILTVIAGNGNPGYTGDGGAARNASFRSLWSIAVTRDGSTIYVADTDNNRIRRIRTADGVLTSSTTSLTFRAKSNGAPSGPQQVTLSGSTSGLVYEAAAQQPWLKLNRTTGATPGAIEVKADPTGLAAGTYNGAITIQSSGAVPPTRTVQVSFVVEAAEAPKLSVDSAAITASTVVGSTPTTRQITVRNLGSGSLQLSAGATVQSGAGWLSVETPNALTAAAAGSVVVNLNPATLTAGTYTGTVRISGAGTSVDVPVVLTVSGAPAKLVLSRTGITFTAVSQGGNPLPQTLQVENAGQGTITWQSRVTTLSGGPSWLKLGASQGSSTANEESTPLLVRADTAGMQPGTYYGQVQVIPPDLAVSPQSASVVLNVLPAGSKLDPEVLPTALIFTGPLGSSPGAQVLQIANLGDQPIGYNASRVTQNAGDWLKIAPASAIVAPGQRAEIIVQADYTELKEGSERASIALQFSSGATRTVPVLAVVSPAGTTISKDGSRSAGGCTPNRVDMQLTSGESPLQVRAGQPVNVEVRVVDSCGEDVHSKRTGAAVSMVIPGEPELRMQNSSGGKWAKSWQSRSSATGVVPASVTAFLVLPNGTILGSQMDVRMNLVSGGAVPLVRQGSLLNGASFQANAPIAPGMLISLFGEDLGADPGVLTDQPLWPVTLSDTEVKLGDKPLRLRFASTGQVNAQIPFDLTPDTEHQVVVRRGAAFSTPENVIVARAQPAIFTTAQNGRGQGAIINAVTGVLTDAATPVRAGDIIAVFATGLGAVSPAVPSGEPASLTVLSRTVAPVTATIGGINATVAFAGLAPGFTGLYQANIVVPAGVPTGAEIPVVIQTAGLSSPPVTIAIR